MKNWNYVLQAMDLPFVRASRINCIVRSLQLKDVYIPEALQKDMD
jgi:hypothetical protein